MSAHVNSRRSLLAALLATPTVAALPASARPSFEQVQKAADALGDAMTRLHARGKWFVRVDHQHGFILVGAPFPKAKPEPQNGNGGAQ